MASSVIEQVTVVRIEELDTCPSDIITDESKIIWGVLEVDGKVYKYNFRDAVKAIFNADPRLPALTARVDELEKKMASIIEGFDENVIIEP